MKSWPEWNDEELANEAQIGIRGQGAVVESTRRLRAQLEAAGESSDVYSRRMWWLNIILAFLTLVQVIAVVPVIASWFR